MHGKTGKGNIVLAGLCIMLCMAFVAGCKNNTGTDSGSEVAGGVNTQKDDVKDSTDGNTGSNTGKEGSAAQDGFQNSGSEESKEEQQRPDRNDGINRNSMERKIAAYLSEIGGPGEIIICDAKSFKYEPYDEWNFLGGDYWELTGADTTPEQLFKALDEQLIDGCGFQKASQLLGMTYFVRAGAERLGITVSCDLNDDGSGSYVTIYMTHAPECYDAEYIREKEASMPDIIPAASALEILPEDFLIDMEYGYMYETLGRKSGSYYYSALYKDSDSGWTYAYLRKEDGSFDKYYSGSYKGTSFRKEGSVTAEKMEEELGNWYDLDGFADDGGLSTWGQMCIDFQAGKTFGDANMRFSITASLVKTGTENIGGVECAVCEDKNIWTSHIFAYDPSTGVMFKIVKVENDEKEELFKVTAYDPSPSSLGTYQ